MAIDASIPLQAKSLNLSEIMADAQQMKMRDMQMREYERKAAAEQNKNSALSDLIATRSPSGGYDTTSEAFNRYRDAAPSDAFELLGKMDEQKRKQVEAGVKDMSAAVQWADTPEKWAVVQQHYGKFDPQLAAVPFQNREQALISLGQMGDYLKSTAPKIITPEAGGGAFEYSPGGGMRTLIQPNDGTQPMGAPVGEQSGGIPRVADEASYAAVKPGQTYMTPDGSVRRKPGGQTPQASGTFQPVGMAGETITSTFRTPAHNAKVGGVSNSFHTRRGLDGKPLARDSVPPRGMSMNEYARRLRALNPHLDVINEGDHVHMEPRG